MYLTPGLQVVVGLLDDAKPMRVRAALSRDGVEVYGDHVNMEPLQVWSLKIDYFCLLFRGKK